MGQTIKRKVVSEAKAKTKVCSSCGKERDTSYYFKTKSKFFTDGRLPICKYCLGARASVEEFSWEFIDKFCQWADIPFILDKFEQIKKNNPEMDVLEIYNNLFLNQEYDGVDWRSYNEAYLELEKNGGLKEIIPGMKEEELRRLQEKWGYNYDEEDLKYLETLYDGLLTTQNISGALQGDQALKICKISCELDKRIREGEDFDKMLTSYDKLVKVAEFTPKNVKNAGDFESISELVRWLEKRGFKNQYYDDVTRDVVDETITNIQSWLQRLYTNESNIGDEVTQRIQSLQNVAKMENYFDVGKKDVDFDMYESEGFEDLLKDEEFVADLNLEEKE